VRPYSPRSTRVLHISVQPVLVVTSLFLFIALYRRIVCAGAKTYDVAVDARTWATKRGPTRYLAHRTQHFLLSFSLPLVAIAFAR